jgi:drug/metabolite transporter (DMT)-like permease
LRPEVKARAKGRWRGDFWAIVSAFATGTGLIAAKAALQTINPITLNSYMFFIGAIIIFFDALISNKVKETIRVRPDQLLFLFIVSIIFCGATFCLFSALSLSEPATVSFLSRLELVATIAFAALFLKERISLSESTGLILVVAGIFVMRYNASVELSKAVALATAASLLFGAGEVTIKSRIDWVNHRALIFYRNLFMSAIFVLVGTATGKFIRVNDINLLLILCVAGLFLPYMGRLGYLKAMQNINVSRASIIVQSQPFFAAAAALIILGTFPPLREVIGGLLIMAGVVTIKLLEIRRKRQ